MSLMVKIKQWSEHNDKMFSMKNFWIETFWSDLFLFACFLSVLLFDYDYHKMDYANKVNNLMK